jgi:hypothetical protein
LTFAFPKKSMVTGQSTLLPLALCERKS